MKKYIAFGLAAFTALCLWACGRKDPEPSTDMQSPTNAPTQTPTSTPDIVPDPTMDTNIPDPTVDSNSTENGSLSDDISDMTK